MQTCPACGEENPEVARFCLACGTPLEGVAVPPREERRVVSVIFVDLVGFIGDAVMGVFGAPRAFGDDAERAVRAALAVRDHVAGETGRPALELRIAVNTGEALVALN